MSDSSVDLDPPTEGDDGWQIADPESEGFDADLLRGIGPHFDNWDDANVHAVLIARHGKLVYERYFAGEDKAWATPLGRVTYDASLKHDLRSISKGIVSLLVGIAVDRGWISDIDAPTLPFLPEYGDLRSPEKDSITLRHLLTMSAGLAWNEYLPYSNPANSERQMINAPDQYRYVLEQPVARPAGVSYAYNGGLTALLGAVLKKVSGRPIDQLAHDELFMPLGIDDVEWVRYANGTPNPASGLRMRPRDLAKIGQLVLNQGIWSGRRIVSASWIEQAISPQIHGDGLFFYGFQWWIGRSLINRQEIKWASAVGWGGQRMYVVPSLNMLVVAMAGLYDNPMLQPVVGEVILRRYALSAAEPGRDSHIS
ncbi:MULTISPECIES: serine hydrolase [unclassified Mesorhizobium]|uniref:serine hydrolase domain-containing protein n=1 Tax=unclassified Mesorhizobium TaxID=325217 RepID=UPI000FE4CEB8|nr:MULTISPECIES: serine hydrolase [unclassified Mesorhizobium]RWB98689.1 MAG: class C beta-lactamase-related serine hydrolase [Mesorhizobium sp.]TGV21946.1 class C beta-lactamase-related serine hydrolase [Mesorhizobium sp. M4B.F.Ca.ET.143.01.1.1]TIU23756.1 MAG: serine hydrolase [Mesorhizobium sp.]